MAVVDLKFLEVVLEDNRDHAVRRQHVVVGGGVGEVAGGVGEGDCGEEDWFHVSVIVWGNI